MGQVKEIFEGFKNLVFPDEEVEALAEQRLKICFECPVRTDNKCDRDKSLNRIKGCGCWLSAKTRSVGSNCPLKKW